MSAMGGADLSFSNLQRCSKAPSRKQPSKLKSFWRPLPLVRSAWRKSEPKYFWKGTNGTLATDLRLLVGKVSQQVEVLLAFAFFAFGSSPMEERAITSSFNLWSKDLTEPERLVPRHGVRLPVIDYTGPTGGRERKSGIIAGVSIAPNTTVGVGFFNTRRAKSGVAPDPQLDRTRRNSKKAAIGISLKF